MKQDLLLRSAISKYEFYIAKAEGYDIYKIGISRDSERRLENQQRQVPFILKHLHVERFYMRCNIKSAKEFIEFNVERQIKYSLDQKKNLRGEWYRFNKEDVLSLISQLKEYNKKFSEATKDEYDKDIKRILRLQISDSHNSMDDVWGKSYKDYQSYKQNIQLQA